MLYAIAAHRSKVTARQFERFMCDIGVKYEAPTYDQLSLFDRFHVSSVYAVEEYAFDAPRLREYFHTQLVSANVAVSLASECVHVGPCGDSDRIKIDLRSPGNLSYMEASTVFNCTYASLNHTVKGERKMTPLRHEFAEIALVDVPEELAGVGVTVMDGPFFSCMPFPAERCHSLSHVKYTPHCYFVDEDGRKDPVREMEGRSLHSRASYMIADAARLMPCLRTLRWRRSLFEAKTVLMRNESDDGRPILLRREPIHPRLYSVLGAKIDNVYDVLLRLDLFLDELSL